MNTSQPSRGLVPWILLGALATSLSLIGCAGDDDVPTGSAGASGASGTGGTGGTGGSGGSGGAAGCDAGQIEVEGVCQAPGVAADHCAAGFESDGSQGCNAILPASPCTGGTVERLGSTTCVAVGVPADACKNGLTSDGGGGCKPILPTQPCAVGLMALPGETTCREIAPCGSGPWGDIDASTVLVDASYQGANGPSDGSASRPWVTIQSAVDASATGAKIAVAAGTYIEDVVISGKAIELQGRCPAMVTIQGVVTGGNTLELDGADGSHIHDLAVRGPGVPLEVVGPGAVTIERIHVPETGDENAGVESVQGAETTLRGSLIEGAHRQGASAFGGTLHIEDCEIRDTLSIVSDGTRGHGIGAFAGTSGEMSTVSIQHTLVARARQYGVIANASHMTLDGVVVIDTLLNAAGQGGTGLGLFPVTIGAGATTVDVKASYISESKEYGVSAISSTLTIEDSTIRDTSGDDTSTGPGLAARFDPSSGARTSMTVKRTLVDNNTLVGVSATAADVSLDEVIVRGTRAYTSGLYGQGVNAAPPVQLDGGGAEAAVLTITGSLIDENRMIGIGATGASGTISTTSVRNTKPTGSNKQGLGIALEAAPTPFAASSFTMSGCIVDGNKSWGIAAQNSDLMVEGILVRNTTGTSQTVVADSSGWGIGSRSSDTHSALLTVKGSVIEKNTALQIVGLGSEVVVEDTTVRDTQVAPATELAGSIVVVPVALGDTKGSLVLKGVKVENSTEFGVLATTDDVEIERLFVSKVNTLSGYGGHGLIFQCDAGASPVSVRGLTIENTHLVGLANFGCNVTAESVRVNDVLPQELDGQFGDGIVVKSGGTLALTNARVENSARAGISAFGSTVNLENVSLLCNTIQINGESQDETSEGEPIDPPLTSQINNLGGNTCTCDKDPSAASSCEVASAGLEPPPAVPALTPPG